MGRYWVDDELLYNSVKTGSQLVWRPGPLVTRCGRGSLHPAEWVSRPLVEQPQRAGKEMLIAIRVGVNMLQFCSVSNSLSHATFQIKWEVYFSERLCRSSLLCRHYDSACMRAILNRSWQQHPTRRQLYTHLPPITKTIQARWTRHAGHCWRSKYEIVSDVLLWTSAYGQSKTGRPAQTFIQQLCDDTGCNPEDLPKAMNDRETWRERGSGISVLATRHDDDDVLCVCIVYHGHGYTTL